MLYLLFSSAFIAATLFPGGSEALLAMLVSQGEYAFWLLILVATVGNTLGAMTSYAIGFVAKKTIASEGRSKQFALKLMERHGIWTLLLSWTPLVGDFLCLAAGWFRYPVVLSFLLILVGKFVRYVVVAMLALKLI